MNTFTLEELTGLRVFSQIVVEHIGDEKSVTPLGFGIVAKVTEFDHLARTFSLGPIHANQNQIVQLLAPVHVLVHEVTVDHSLANLDTLG